MKNNIQNNNQNATFTSATKLTLVLMFALLLLSGVKMFAQSSAATIESPIQITQLANDEAAAPAPAAVSESNANMNMVSWFMGTKQTPKAETTTDGTVNSKRQMINSGVAPNRLLMKSFLKKAAAFQSAVA